MQFQLIEKCAMVKLKTFSPLHSHIRCRFSRASTDNIPTYEAPIDERTVKNRMIASFTGEAITLDNALSGTP
jgi:hypothetical protein